MTISATGDILSEGVRTVVREQRIDPAGDAAAVHRVATQVVADHEARSLTGAVNSIEEPDLLIGQLVADVAGGVSTRTLALVGGGTGVSIGQHARSEGLDTRLVVSESDTRQCQCYLDEATGVVTEFYEPVRPVTDSDLNAILTAYSEELKQLKHDDLIVLSGRVPDGMPPGALAELVAIARAAGIRVALDSDGEGLKRAIASQPAWVKVNSSEALSAAGSTADAVTAALALQRLSGGHVIVTQGAAGCVGVDENGAVHELLHEPLPHAFPVGSGDAFLAGMAAVLLRGEAADEPTLDELLVAGVAAARVNAKSFMAGSVDGESWMEEMAQLRTQRGIETHTDLTAGDQQDGPGR